MSLRIKFRSASLDQFIERYAVDVSRGGIFIRTREPLPVGTQLRFDFQLQDTTPLLGGEGTIVWIRENDPSRAGVTPGMGVRFDKLTPASQPTLEKILAEKARREQAGAPAKTGPAGGMAVRRPSSTFSALDPAAARAAQAASGPPRVGGLSPLGAQPRPAPAAPAGAVTGAQPRTTAPAIGSDPFGTGRSTSATTSTSRTVETAVPAGLPTLEASGAFGRPRSTTGMNAQRPAPAPSALFEKPTADDIDRALSVLTEIDGPAPALVAPPADFSSRTRTATDPQQPAVDTGPSYGDAAPGRIRRPTDAQPMVLESAPDVGDAPARRSGTRPLFSGTGEMKVQTVPVIPIGDAPELDADEVNEDSEDDATSAWLGSGPTKVGGAESEPPAAKLPAASAPAPYPRAASAPPMTNRPELPKAEAPLPSLDEPAPGAAVVPAIAAPAPRSARPPGKSTSGATIAMLIIVLLAAAGGGGYYVFKGPGRSLLGGVAPAPAPAPAPAATAPVAAPEGTAPAAQANTADAAVPPSAAAATVDKAAPAAEAPAPEPKAPAPEAKAPEAQAAEAAPAPKPEGKSAGHRGKHHGGASSEAAAEAAPVVADVSPKAPAEAPTAPAAGGGHILKISSSPAGAEVIVDGSSMGTTPFSSGDVDPALPHSVTIKKDGFESYEHMLGGSDWPRAKNGVRTLRLNAKLRATGGAEGAKPAEADPPAESAPGLGTTPASPKRE